MPFTVILDFTSDAIHRYSPLHVHLLAENEHCSFVLQPGLQDWFLEGVYSRCRAVALDFRGSAGQSTDEDESSGGEHGPPAVVRTLPCDLRAREAVYLLAEIRCIGLATAREALEIYRVNACG